MADRDTAYNMISELVARFADQYDSYKKADYNETLTRRDFIDPFFKALGWDMDNTQGYAESYREVIHEDRVKVSGATKAPDYAFRLAGGKRLFFVEAKKPSLEIKDNGLAAYQLRRYGWSAKLPISIITNFEEFALYDCTVKPKITDKASTARIKYLSFRDYEKEFDFIWEIFSKERVLKGGLDRFVQSDTHKKGTATVDKEFLKLLDEWRKYLAISIAINNKQLNEEELNFAVQQTIDRIIFLRISEDRGVEPYGALKNALQGEYYKNLFKIFQEASEKYNSSLFDFEKDSISSELKIDNKVIKTIISELYYPESPYEFSVLSVEILGSAYEQFLGKIIRITPAHHVKIEEKPEVRKAGGVYYTPQYIVEYIVKNTVGKLIEGKSPKEISKIKILDPACGSGSFLLEAYQYLLNYHKDYYSNTIEKSKGKKGNPLTPDGNLTTAEKKRILTNNIFGVDLDVNAVEVTKLSLLLKCMEGETEASIETQLRLFNERVLPDLDDNIKSGNSLIDIDFYETQIDFGEERKIKPFNWQRNFPEVFKQGGFDVVIGNPPYVVIEGIFRNDKILPYLRKSYRSALYKVDLYHLFIEKGIKLLKSSGNLGYITPSNYFSNNSSAGLRETILQETTICILNNIKGKVFSGVSVDTAITILSKSKEKKKSLFIHSLWKENKLQEISSKKFNQKIFNESNEKVFISTSQKIKFRENTIKLGEICFVKFGMQLRNREKFESDVITKDKKKFITKFHRPCYTGSDVDRWMMTYNNLLAYFNMEAKTGGCWDKSIHDANPKIIVRQIGEFPICALDEKGYCCLNTVFMIVPKPNSSYDVKFIIGVLNSSFIAFFWKQNYSDLRKTFPKIKGTYLKKLPIPSIDFKEREKKVKHDEIVKLVQQILKLCNQKYEAKLQSTISLLQEKIEYCEIKINKIVYDLYGLNEEEIKVIESELEK